MKTRFELICSTYSNTVIDDYAINPTAVTSGVIFIYTPWSPTIVQLQSLVASLEGDYNFPLYIFEIDKANSIGFLDKHGLISHGWGETFWVREGNFIATMKKYTSADQEKLIAYHDLLK